MADGIDYRRDLAAATGRDGADWKAAVAEAEGLDGVNYRRALTDGDPVDYREALASTDGSSGVDWRTSSTVQGGGGVPAWLEAFRAPGGDLPTFAMDVESGNYWAGQEVSFDAIVDATGFDGETNYLEPGVGLHLNGQLETYLLGDVAGFLLAGSWTVLAILQKELGNSGIPLIVSDEGGSVQAVIAYEANGNIASYDFDINGGRDISGGPGDKGGAVPMAIAVTRTDAKMVGSVLGETIISDTSPIVSLIGAEDVAMSKYTGASGGGYVLKQLIGYGPQPDSDLPILSAL